MHNSLFGNIAEGPRSGREGMPVGEILNQLTTFVHEQNQEIQALIKEIRKTIICNSKCVAAAATDRTRKLDWSN